MWVKPFSIQQSDWNNMFVLASSWAFLNIHKQYYYINTYFLEPYQCNVVAQDMTLTWEQCAKSQEPLQVLDVGQT